VLSEVSISARGYDPLLFARAFNLHAKTEMMIFLLHAFSSGVGLHRLFVRKLAIQGSLEIGAFARAIFVNYEHKSTNMTRVTSVCTKWSIHNDRKYALI